MLTFLITLAVFIATALQALVAFVEMREAHHPALQTARAETELAQGVPFWRRRRVLRELRSWRDPDTDKSLALGDAVLFSWTLLMLASGTAAVRALPIS